MSDLDCPPGHEAFRAVCRGVPGGLVPGGLDPEWNEMERADCTERGLSPGAEVGSGSRNEGTPAEAYGLVSGRQSAACPEN